MRMVKVEFTASAKIAIDGIHVTKFSVGDIADLPEAVAAVAVGAKSAGGLGAARVVGYVAAAPVVEKKDVGAAPMNKVAMPSEVKEPEPELVEDEKPQKKAPAAARGRGRGKR